MSLFKRQVGAALLIFLTILVLGVTALLLSGLNQTQSQLNNDIQTRQALAQAKEVLLGYAAAYYDSNPGQYGFLPCPDVNAVSYAEGVEHGNCVGKNKSGLGRFPWRTLGIPPLRDGAGECLWYAISGDYKNASFDTVRTNLLNEDTTGLFKIALSEGQNGENLIAGATPTTRVVAVIIAPGRLLPSLNQNRAPTASGTEICGGNYTVTNYLESNLTTFAQNADQVEKFPFLAAQDILAQDSEKVLKPINDRLVYITTQEIWEATRKRKEFYKNMKCLSQLAAHCVANYVKTNPNLSNGNQRLPWAAPLTLTDYRDDAQYDDEEDLLAGRLPNKLDNSNAKIAKTVPDYLFIATETGKTGCNFTEMVNSDLSECSGGLKAITRCNPNSTTVPNDLVWCNAAAVPLSERIKDPVDGFDYKFAYSSPTYEKLITCDLEDPKLTQQQKDECKIISNIRSSNNALSILKILWQNWKDHLFYAVSTAYQPTASVPISACNSTSCLQLNSKYCAAIVIFAGTALSNQSRLSPPTDSDKKANATNYLEGNNATNITAASGNGVYEQQSISATFNDILYCIEGK